MNRARLGREGNVNHLPPKRTRFEAVNGAAMMRQKAGECTLFLATLLAACVILPPASKGQDSLPPFIETLYDLGQYGQAAEALQVAVKRSPEDASLDYWLGRSLFEVREFSKAIESFERAVKIDTNSSNYHDWLGRAYGRKAEENSHSNMPAALPPAPGAPRIRSCCPT
jgi:predicted Zn-dependent protease